MNYSCYVISNKPHLFPPIQESANPEKINYFDGTGYESFSKLVNVCVAGANTEIVIIMSDKVLPTQSDILKVVSLVEQGYGLVGLYRFGFFGFKRQLMRQIGMMDERYVGGGYEDDDMYIRLKEANISMYMTEEIEYQKSVSSWNYSLSRNHFVNKWVDTESPRYNPTARLSAVNIKRKINEEQLNYNLGEEVPTEFLSWGHTFASATKSRKYI
jgi:hypothetical protein